MPFLTYWQRTSSLYAGCKNTDQTINIRLCCYRGGKSNALQIDTMADRYSISTLRLPRNVVPNHYSLKIKIDLVKCNFNGSAEVDVTVNESTSSVLLNSLGLAVSEGEFQCGSNTICVKETQELKADERIEFIFGRPIHKGTGILRYSFSAGLSEDQRGLYRCEAWDEKNRRMNFAATSFESADARRAFPCWDEPALKATFQVTMITQRPYLVLSNMPIIEQKKYSEEGWLMTLFECTPKMSTYLLSFVVGRFNYIEAFSARRVRIRVYAMVDKENQGEYALQTAVKSLDFFENYFDIPYPLAKVDLVALPETSAGSMENWGLITFR
ncbi:aminopeptidase M1-B-like isoform X1 [Varroa jacobsoni]|uniref:aminopeptidase M1-B-like isoform X1 n=1 Tax=Varroa jacobsoni TaxID=62625 RepID=UPI000BF95C1D|nr:aminopeptidase M1-B-like isoform X1 [Varroa jacobsoni]